MFARARPVAGALGRLAGLLAAGLLWQSLFWQESVPLATKAGFAILALTAAWRPAVALLVVAGLVGIAPTLSMLIGTPPGRTAEAIVLSFLTGWFARRALRGETSDESRDPLGVPAIAFACVVGASLVVMTSVAQPAVAPPWPFMRLLVDQLATRYLHAETFETHNWAQAALLIEGLILALVTLGVARKQPNARLPLMHMLVAGGVAGAALSCLRLGQALLRSSDVEVTLERALTSARLSYHMTDFNAAGSHFVLVLPLTIALGWMAWRSKGTARSGVPWFLATALLLVALWLTGSRAAQFSIALAAALTAVVGLGRRHAAVVGVITVVAISAIVLTIVARPAPESSVVATLRFRWLFAQMSWEMWQTAPVFGVGIAEYFVRSAALMPAPLKVLYQAENAHNNFLQIGVELGLVGLGTFLWLLVSAASRVIGGLRTRTADPALVALAAGIGSTLLTFLTGHPLLVANYAYCFWIAVGLAVGLADVSARDTALRSPLDARASHRVAWLAMAGVTVLALSVPVRAHFARSQVDVSAIRYGFVGGARDPRTGDTFDLVGPVGTVFAERTARRLSLTVSQMSADTPVQLELRIDGELVNRIVLRDGLWQDIRMLLPVSRTGHAFRRIDLLVSTGAARAADNQCRIRWVEIR